MADKKKDPTKITTRRSPGKEKAKKKPDSSSVDPSKQQSY